MKKQIESVKKAISEGDLKIAIVDLNSMKEELSKIIRREKYLEFETLLISISASYQAYEKGVNLGTLIQQEQILQLNQIVTRLLYLISLIDEIDAKGIKDVFGNIQGMTRIDPDKAHELTVEKLKDAQWMKIVGAGRQDYAEASDDNPMLYYYSEVEKKMQAITKTKKPFTIRRIAPSILKNKFYNHLKKCYEITSKNKNIYNVILYEDLKLISTYYIIKSYNGEKILFFTLYRFTPAIPMFDITMTFYTTDNEIIEEFDKLFERFWLTKSIEGRVITNLTDFNRFTPFNEKLHKKFNEIKQFVKGIPNDSVRMKHLKREIDIMHRRLEGLKSCNMIYGHSSKNQRITDCFLDYIDDLDENKSYKTVSVLNFWKMLHNVEKFFDLQNEALFKDAKVSRIYLVDSNSLLPPNTLAPKTNEDVNFERYIVKKNYEQWKKHKNNYRFKIIFSTLGRESTKSENFALWHNKKINYKVIFRINYSHFKAATDVSFANFRDDNIHRNQSLIEGYERNFEMTLKRAQDENNKLLNYFKQKSNKNNEFEQNDTFERQLAFLKDCTIDNLEEFLSIT